MKTRLDRLSELASDATSLASQGSSKVREAAAKASTTVQAAGKSVHKMATDAIDHRDTKAAVLKAKDLATAATVEARKIADRVVFTAKKADENHKDVADKIETVSMGLGITSGVVLAGAALAAPTGLGALGVAIGITSAPLIVAVAPAIAAVATVTGVVSGGAYFYSKWKSRKSKGVSKNE